MTLTDKSPIGLFVKDLLDMCCHLESPRRLHPGIVTQVVLGSVACHLYNLAVLCQVSDMQVEGDTALLGTLHIARAAQFHVLLGDNKAVVGLGHHLQPVPCVTPQVVTCHKNAVALVSPAPYPAPELMQLRQAKSLTSMTVVATRICALPLAKSIIWWSFSAGFMRPCTMATL